MKLPALRSAKPPVVVSPPVDQDMITALVQQADTALAATDPVQRLLLLGAATDNLRATTTAMDTFLRELNPFVRFNSEDCRPLVARTKPVGVIPVAAANELVRASQVSLLLSQVSMTLPVVSAISAGAIGLFTPLLPIILTACIGVGFVSCIAGFVANIIYYEKKTAGKISGQIQAAMTDLSQSLEKADVALKETLAGVSLQDVRQSPQLDTVLDTFPRLKARFAEEATRRLIKGEETPVTPALPAPVQQPLMLDNRVRISKR